MCQSVFTLLLQLVSEFERIKSIQFMTGIMRVPTIVQ